MEGSAAVFAVIDIGSNSTRLLLASKQGGRFAVQDKKLRSARIGEELASRGVLSEEGMARTLAALEEYRDIARAEEAAQLYAFATSAVREASNRQTFLERCRAIDLEVEVLDGRMEALMAYMGAMP